MKTVKLLLNLLVTVTLANAAPLFAQLQIVASTPSGQTRELGASQEIVVTFSEPVTALTAVADSTQGPLVITPGVAGTFRWLGTASFAFTPDEPLPYATNFSCRIPAGTRAISGNMLAQDFVWSFQTPRPQVLRFTPRANQQHVASTEPIWLYFNQPIDSATAAKFIVVKNRQGRVVPVTLRHPTREELRGSPGVTTPKRPLGRRPIGSRRMGSLSQQADDHAERLKNLVITAVKGWQRDDEITVQITKGLVGTEGRLPMLDDVTFSFKTRRTFRVDAGPSGKVSPTATLTFRFTNPVRIAELAKNLQFQPEVVIPEEYLEWSWSTDAVDLALQLLPDTTYRYTIAAGLTDTFGDTLGKSVTGEFTTGDYEPSINMPVGYGLLETGVAPRYPVEVLNVVSVRLALALLSPDSLIAIAGAHNDYELFARNKPLSYRFPMEREWQPVAPKNQSQRLPLDLRQALGPATSGIVAVQLIRQNEKEVDYYKALVQVTSLGLTGKFSPANNVIFVTRHADATPVAGTAVEIRSIDNKVLWQGQTGADGTVETPGWAQLGLTSQNRWESPKFYVFAYHGDDIAFCRNDWDAGIDPWRFDIPYDWYPQPTRLSANLQTDRGIYRTGETMFCKGIVRQLDSKGRWHIPVGPALQMLIQDARGDEVLKKEVTLSDFGAFDDSLEIDSIAPLGLYWMNLSWKPSPDGGWEHLASVSFRVEAFRAAEFEVKILPIKPPIGDDEYLFGDSLHAQILGRYLFGAPMQRAPVSWRLQMAPYAFAYPQWPGYVFDNRARRQGEDRSTLLAAGQDSLRADGTLDVRALLVGAGYESGASLLIEGTATGPSRQQISGRKAVKIHRGEFAIGLKTDGYLVATNEALTCSVAVITPPGAPDSGRAVTAKVYQIQWNSVRKAGVGGRYEWLSQRVETVVDSSRLVSTSQPLAYRFTPQTAGYYLIEVRGQDGRGNPVVASQGFYASGAGYVAWARSDDDLIKIIPDAPEYAPGDTARLLVQSPFESAQALITVEREAVMTTLVQQAVGSAVTIKVPIGDDFLPNVFVSVVLLYGRSASNKFDEAGSDLGKPQFKIGYAMLNVSPNSRRLEVHVDTDRAQYRPRDTVSLSVSAIPTSRDRDQDKFVPAEFTVAVVDAGVLNLIGYQLQDPFDSFYGPRDLSVRTAETLLHLIEQRNYGEKGEEPGGGGAEFAARAGVDMRSKFKALAYWHPSLRPDATGKARVTFVLPDNLTTFRVMVIAHSKQSEFGADHVDFVVNKPLLLQASTPRFVRIGDRFEAGVVATNNSSQPGEFRVQGKADGLTFSGKSEAKATLRPGESREFRLQFAAAQTGTATFQFQAEMRLFPAGRERETDGLQWQIPISMPQTRETVATFGSTADDVRETLVVPQDIFTGQGQVEISAASTALVGLRESVDYLFGYPYGCLEQRLSRVLPMILADKLVQAFGLPGLKDADYRAVVQQTLQEIAGYQQFDGGFSLWKGGDTAYPYVSAYALWALAAAKQNGYAVPERLLQNAINYNNELLRLTYSAERWPWGGKQTYLATRALAYYALGLAGVRDVHYGEVLFKERAEMPLFAKGFLLRGLALHQVTPGYRTGLASELLNLVKVEAATAHFEESDDAGLWWCWSSTARTTGIVLQALLESDAPFPLAERVVRWLMEERKLGRWRSTQENIYIFHALATYLEKYESEMPDFSASIKIAGQSFLQETFAGRSTTPMVEKVQLTALPTGKDLPVEIEKKGTGRLYYGLRMTYFPRQPAPARDQGLSIAKQVEIFREPAPSRRGESKSEGVYPAGGMIKVTLTITVPQERHFVVINDPLPAGFEAVNLRLQTEATGDPEVMGIGREQSGGWYFGFNHTEMHDDRVLLFANVLRAGVHTYSYLARATTLGTFAAPAPYGEEMYAPEIFGRGEAGTVVIK